jgi:hypothetical protein
MSLFNITAQIYDKNDSYKQSIFMNELVMASSSSDAKNTFEQIYSKTHQVIRVFSVEEISQDTA